MNKTLHAHGKLLLTAEYFVLDGAKALAVPVRFGQSLTIQKQDDTAHILWKSLDEKGKSWFEACFDSQSFEPLHSSDKGLAERLAQIFSEAKKLNNDRLPATAGQWTTRLSFPRNWGLGTSSTLIYLLAKWTGVNSFELQFNTFGGSGYDIACAGADGPLFYQLENGVSMVEPCKYFPPFAEHLYFIFLGKKQNSREGIARYRKGGQKVSGEEVSALTDAFFAAKELDDLDKIILEHEKLIGSSIGLSRAKELYFPDYWGEVKSLGAWGGDFVLVTTKRPEGETRKYFNEKGLDVFFRYGNMVL